MEHDLQKKQELELWNMVSSGKPGAGGKSSEQNTAKNETGSTEPKLPNHFPFKKTAQAVRGKKHESAGYAFIG